jgi:hypothetical protein
MPHGHHKAMQDTAEQFEQDGMEFVGYAPDGDAPDWIQVPRDAPPGNYSKINGDNYVYILVLNGLGKAKVYRQLKSEYYTTNSQSGTCPNCQKYVRRFDEDDYLTCHRCGWKYKTFSDRLKALFP